MHARDYDFVCKKWPEAVQLALSPPTRPGPTPPLFPRSELQRHAVTDVLAAEYQSYLKEHGGQANSFTWDAFMNEKKSAAQLKNAEAECQRWADEHETYEVSESNRTAMWNWLQDNDLVLTYANLDKAFAALVASGDVTVKPPDSDWQSGAWRNGVWVPDGTGAAQRRNVDPSRAASEEKKVTKRVSQMSAHEFLSNLNESPSFKHKVDSTE
jgi:hypothetical protein